MVPDESMIDGCRDAVALIAAAAGDDAAGLQCLADNCDLKAVVAVLAGILVGLLRNEGADPVEWARRVLADITDGS